MSSNAYIYEMHQNDVQISHYVYLPSVNSSEEIIHISQTADEHTVEQYPTELQETVTAEVYSVPEVSENQQITSTISLSDINEQAASSKQHQRKSAVWKYFKHKGDDKNVATCNICGNDYKIGLGTKNLKTHLIYKHSQVATEENFKLKKVFRKRYRKRVKKSEDIIKIATDNQTFYIKVNVPQEDTKEGGYQIVDASRIKSRKISEGTSKRSSYVWEYFQGLEDTKDIAVCTLCDKSYRTGGGTSNLMRHLTLKHTICKATDDTETNRTEFEEEVLPNLEEKSAAMEEEPIITKTEHVDDLPVEPNPAIVFLNKLMAPKKRKTKSYVWNYFTLVEGSQRCATCNICDKKYMTGGGTSNLRQHLKNKHPYETALENVDKLSSEIVGEASAEKLRRYTKTTQKDSYSSTEEDATADDIVVFDMSSLESSEKYQNVETAEKLRSYTNTKQKDIYSSTKDEDEEILIFDESSSDEEFHNATQSYKDSLTPFDVWNYFDKIGTKKNIALCKICGKLFKSTKEYRVLQLHLLNEHYKLVENNRMGRKEIKEEIISNERVSAIIKPRTLRSLCGRSIQITRAENNTDYRFSYAHQSDGSESPRHNRFNYSDGEPLQENLDAHSLQMEMDHIPESFETNCRKETVVTDGLTFMICKENLPYSFVESEGFSVLMKTLLPSYELPSSTTIARMLQEKYETICCALRIKLQNQPFLALSADLCTVPNVSSNQYLIITCHFIVEDCAKIRSVQLEAKSIEANCNEEIIVTVFKNILDKFGIEKEQVLCVCAGYDTAILSAIQLVFGEEKHLTCCSHIIDSIVRNTFTNPNNNSLKTLVERVKNILVFAAHNESFRNEIKLQQMASDISVEDILTSLTSVQEQTFKWELVYYVLKKFVNFESCISRVLMNDNFKNAPAMLNKEQLDIIAETISILAPFEEARNEITCSEYLAGSLVLPMLNCVLAALKTITPVHHPSSICLKMILVELTETMLHSIETHPMLCLATLCDPRFKSLYVASSKVSSTVATLGEETRLEIAKNQSTAVNQYITNMEKNVSSLWKTHEKKVLRQNLSLAEVETDTSSSGTNLPEELDVYIQDSPKRRSSNPIEYWLSGKELIPGLAPVALKYLSVIGSSSSSEKLVNSLSKIIAGCKNKTDNNAVHISQLFFLQNIDKSFWFS